MTTISSWESINLDINADEAHEEEKSDRLRLKNVSKQFFGGAEARFQFYL